MVETKGALSKILACYQNPKTLTQQMKGCENDSGLISAKVIDLDIIDIEQIKCISWKRDRGYRKAKRRRKSRFGI